MLNDRVRFDFGTLVNAPDGVRDVRDQLVVEVVALVVNSGDNINGDRLVNAAAMGDAEASADIEIVEPQLNVQKSAAVVDGTRVRYTVRIEHDPASTADAYTAVLRDLLAGPGITLDDGTVTIATGTTVPAGGGNIAITTGNGTGDTTVRLDVASFPRGTVLVVTYEATLNSPGGQTLPIDNTANLTWNSVPGGGRTGTDSDAETLGAIGDRVWFDADGDGVQDAGESGLPGVTMQLVWAGPDNNLATAGDNVTYGTTTGANGVYQFSGLPAGNYRVTATQPAGTVPTFDNQGGLDNRSELTLLPGQSNTLQDFGYLSTASIGDRVWLDEDGDGRQDAGEDGIAQLTVRCTTLRERGVVDDGDGR